MDANRPRREELHNPHVHYEPGDVNAPFLTKFGIGMAFLIIIFLFGLWGLFEYFVHREMPIGVSPAQTVLKLPPEPRLQVHAARDMQDMLAAEKRAMGQYGWVDPDKGIVRIPVALAMDVIAKRGLPVRPNPGVPPGEKRP